MTVAAEARQLPILFTGEMWRPVVGFEGRYEVSRDGRVRSLNRYRAKDFGKTLSPYTQNKGYQYLSLRTHDGGKRTLAVHRLVLEAFVGPCPPGKQAAHGNGDPADNRVENLRWASAAENIADRARHGRTARGEACGSSKLDRKAVKTIKRLRGAGLSATEVAHLACVNPTTVQDIWDGETWRHL